MKLSYALSLLLVPFRSSSFAAGAADRELGAFEQNDAADGGERRLDDEDAEEEDQVTFQLKMYWEEGYRWQGESFDRKWCLECDNRGENCEIQRCGGARDQRFVYEEVPGSGGGRIKPARRQDLCWTRTGRRELELQPCDLNCRQIITGVQYEGRFEMHSNGRPLECLEQHHHPRAGEVVRSKSCIESRDDKTSFWIMINKRGGNYTNNESNSPALRGSTEMTDIGNDVCSEDNPCGLCMGDCDRDNQCHNGLECMRREDNEPVPGCTGDELEENDGLDVCFDPYGNYTLPPTMAPTTSTAPTESPAPTPYVELYGDCEFIYPSASPSESPTDFPSISPSDLPTFIPSASPSILPTLSALPTSSHMPSVEPTYTGYCEPDDEGMFGEEASTAVSVDYVYELVTDPALDIDTDAIVSALEQGILTSMLPTLFSDECTTGPSRRRLVNASYSPSGASGGYVDVGGDGVNCTGFYSEIYDCTVVNASMTVFTDGNETYDDLLLPILKDYMDSGVYDDLNPAIVNMTYVNQTESSGGDESTTGSSSGVQNPALFAILGVGIVVLVLGLVWWKRSKTEQTITSDKSVEVAPQNSIVKAESLNESMVKEQAAYVPNVVEDDSVEEVNLPDTTFDTAELEEDEEFDC